MVTGLLFMTRKKINTPVEDTSTDYNKLSIQVSLSGLSFCVLDTIDNKIIASESISFGKELTPYEVQKQLKDLFETHKVQQSSFSEVVVIHRNPLFSLVPKSLFDPKELANYLKFNAKILANDHIDYDHIEPHEMVNVYVPFVNINNYIYDLFGEFQFMHTATVLIQTLFNSHGTTKEPICYVHLSEYQMDVTIIGQKKLLFYNSFIYHSKEDFIYYLLFALEQLKLDTETIKVKLFGAIEEGDDIYTICYDYVKNIAISIPSNSALQLGDLEKETIDFTLLNAL